MGVVKCRPRRRDDNVRREGGGRRMELCGIKLNSFEMAAKLEESGGTVKRERDG